MYSLRILAGVMLMLVGALNAATAQSVHPAPLSIDRLYSLPWATGTSPTAPTWADDSRQIAYLWNEDGGNFRDVWVHDTNSGKTQRITRMPRTLQPEAPGKDIDQLVQVERAEVDAGVTAVSWLPDRRHLIINFHGRLYRVAAGMAPQPLFEAQGLVEDFALAPRTGTAAFLRSGVLLSGTPAPQQSERVLYDAHRSATSVESFLWSRDGRRIAFVEADVSQVPERGIPQYLGAETTLPRVRRAFPGEPSAARRIGIVNLADGVVRWVDWSDDHQDEIFGLAWSPDGATLLIDKSDLYIKDRRLLLVDVEHLQTRELLREQDPNNVTAEWWADFGPDGRGIYFISDRDNDYHVYYEPLSGGLPQRITGGDCAVFGAWISARSRALFVLANEGRAEQRQVFRVPLRGGEWQAVTASPGAHKPQISPDGKWIADVFSNDVTPPELYLQPSAASSRGALQITRSPPAEFRNYPWIAAHYVTFKSADGTALQARLTLPRDFDPGKQYPAILGSTYSNTVHNEWGGRIYHPTWGIDQFLVSQGYVIMNVDISGSSGHGKLFRQRIREDYGGVDVEDLASGVRYLIAQGFVDPKRVGIWGSSYGGLLTTTSLFVHPELYRAGVAGAPATSLYHAQTGEMRTMMAPQDHAAAYEKSSAYLKSGGLAGHLLIIHGMRDDTVLFKDSVVLTQRLILQGGDVDFVMLPNAPHGWDTEGLAQTRFAYHKLFDHFERHLKYAIP